jgi:sporulation protein YlmC with PRC-barrel domain
MEQMMKENLRLETLSATTLIGDPVRNAEGDELGQIENFMIDLKMGCIVYAVLSFGGFMGFGDKLFAIPWASLQVDLEAECFRMDINKDSLKKAPGFDKDDWPTAISSENVVTIYEFYGVENPDE